MKNQVAIYWKWTWAFRHSTPLCVVMQTLATLSLQLRKDVLSLARTQSPVVPGSYLEQTLEHLYTPIRVPSSPSPTYDMVEYVSMSFRDMITIYQDAFLDPLQASLVALAARISPSTTYEEYSKAMEDSVFKEVSAAITRFSGARLDYRCIFSSDLRHRQLPFTDRLLPDPEVASDTFQTFCRLRARLSNKLVFPSTGRKTVGHAVEEHFWQAYFQSGCIFKHDGPLANSDVTPRDCLKLYEETGGYVEGPVELRSAWKYAQIGPRIYYARGGDVLPTSQYIQPIVNEIIDAFPETHRKNRFSPPQNPIEPDDVELIYDYSSFTSTLDDVVEFVRQLALFFRGVNVVLIDVRDGPINMDLGELFEKYNRDCNEYPTFDGTRLLAGVDDARFQHTCGMLGVEGNIFLATLLHGLHLRFLAGLLRSRCIGDDARYHKATMDGQLTKDEQSLEAWRLSGIGGINDKKIGKFEARVDPVMQAYRYVKRPIHRDTDIMIEGLLFDLPSLIPLYPLADQYHTVYPSTTHPCRQTFKAIIRLLRVLRLHSLSKEENEVGMRALNYHVMFLLDEIRSVDPSGKYAPTRSAGRAYRIPPLEVWGKMDYEEWILQDLMYDEVVRFSKRGGGSEEGSCDGRVGSTMVREVSKGRSFLEKMGYVTREDMFDEVSIADVGRDEMRVYLSGSYRSVCTYTVIAEIPSWYSMIPGTL